MNLIPLGKYATADTIKFVVRSDASTTFYLSNHNFSIVTLEINFIQLCTLFLYQSITSVLVASILS